MKSLNPNIYLQKTLPHRHLYANNPFFPISIHSSSKVIHIGIGTFTLRQIAKLLQIFIDFRCEIIFLDSGAAVCCVRESENISAKSAWIGSLAVPWVYK